MDKTLQTTVWNCLPKEFKEEVKRLYANLRTNEFEKGCGYAFETIFGYPNLTSDAEGEEDEMLHVSRKKLQYFYEKLRKVGENHAAFALQSLFGSKCLPDEEPPLKITAAEDCIAMAKEEMGIKDEPKPAEPKFKVGDKVKDISSPHDGGIYKVDDIKKSSDGFIYHIQGLIGKSNVKESDLEPYTELTGNKIGNPDISTETLNASKSVPLESDSADHIVQDHGMVDRHNDLCDKLIQRGFRDHNRLHIAAMAMQGILSNEKATQYAINNFRCSDGTLNRYWGVAECSLAYADALIKEAEKGDKQ